MGFYVKRATGKARCTLCHQPIEKADVAIGFAGYQFNYQCHMTCLMIEVAKVS